MKKRFIFFILIIFVLLVACSEKEESSKEKLEEETEIHEKSVVEKKNIYPLTGVGTNDPVNQRIISVMVNNHTNARPQTGLSDADIVFEILAEGPITRFLALYQSEIPDVIGPVRSAREYYFELANGYDALYVYHGAAGFVNEMIYNRGIEHIDGFYRDNDGILFKRDQSRNAPHNSYLLTDEINEVAKEKGYETTMTYEALPFLTEDEIALLDGEEAEHVAIVYSNSPMEIVEFDYDETTEKYTRFNDGEETVERERAESIQVDNVFIVETDHQIIDDVGRRAVNLESGGSGYLIQKGTVTEVNWENKEGRIIPIKEGEQVGFVPGQTWINVVPTSPGIEQSVTITSNEM